MIAFPLPPFFFSQLYSGYCKVQLAQLRMYLQRRIGLIFFLQSYRHHPVQPQSPIQSQPYMRQWGPTSKCRRNNSSLPIDRHGDFYTFLCVDSICIHLQFAFSGQATEEGNSLKCIIFFFFFVLHTHIYNSFIYNTPELERSQMSINM